MKVRELIERLLEFDMGYEVRVKFGKGDFADNVEPLEVRRVNGIDQFPRIEIVTDRKIEAEECLDAVIKTLEQHGYVEKP